MKSRENKSHVYPTGNKKAAFFNSQHRENGRCHTQENSLALEAEKY